MDKLTSIIDAIGDASYRVNHIIRFENHFFLLQAQGLPGPVTTARKFRISDHRLYIVKSSSDHKYANTC